MKTSFFLALIIAFCATLPHAYADVEMGEQESEEGEQNNGNVYKYGAGHRQDGLLKQQGRGKQKAKREHKDDDDDDSNPNNPMPPTPVPPTPKPPTPVPPTPVPPTPPTVVYDCTNPNGMNGDMRAGPACPAGQTTGSISYKCVKPNWVTVNTCSNPLPPTPPPPAPVVTFSTLKTNIFGKCVGCHGNYDTYAGIRGVVTPGNANGSTLVIKLLETGHPGTRLVTPQELQSIKDWINAGALNN